MPTTRKRQRRAGKSLKPAEYAFLTGDDSEILPGTRDAARLRILRTDPDAWLVYGDRTANQLLHEFPEYKKL
ncbi:MAG: hypothetical protein PF482_15265 [Desulfobacteraceae bacterium]|jgi:hypothetical protein|nr:hypothetical protein [Desulfobacteraceae bacterium]